jgi:arabinan endo-1,5-alpha-L-arabinosidase
MSSYNQWGFQTVGECAQGHNSVIAAKDGRTYLVYHTKFNDGTYGHLVRVHQLFLNENGWLVAAPFEYNGEEQTDEQNATTQLFERSQMPGKWQLLVHKYGLNHEKMEEVLPVEIELLDDGTITGEVKGKWELVNGTTYIHITINSVPYYGVLTEQQMEPTSIKALCFTALSSTGVPVWGYKIREKYQLARQVNTQTMPVSSGRRISGNVDLYGIDLLTNVNLEWTSNQPEVITPEGR